MIFQGVVIYVLLQLIQPTTSQECSLLTGNVNGVQLFDYPSFSPTSPITKTWTNIVNSQLQLTVEETNGGVVGYAWHNRQERIADGFISIVTFNVPVNTMNGGKAGDGFTYFIQHDKIVDLNGGTGDKLGSFGIKRSIAVGVDLCYDRPTCSKSALKIIKTDENYQQTILAPPSLLAASLANGFNHTLTVVYAGRSVSFPNISVSLDGVQVFNVQAGNLETLFSSRFAYFGFTASTSWDQTATINIAAWSVSLQPTDVAVQEYATANAGTIKLVYGTKATFVVQRRNTCKLPLAIADPTANVSAWLFEQPQTQILYAEDYVYLKPNITDRNDGTWLLEFALPTGYLGKFDLDVNVSGVRAESMPWINSIETVKPPPQQGEGLPIWALVLLILLTLLLIIVISYVVYRLHRYRKKLRENEEFIKAGKKQAELDKLEDGTSYVANPMVGTVDDLKAQLEKNNAELERLRKRGELGEDQDYTIAQLQKQRDDLLEDMNRLKREEQERGVENATAGRFGQVTEFSKTRKEFGQKQV
jgi:hypothetical protein